MGISANEDAAQMAKEELLTIEGVVDEILPDGRFGVMLDNRYRIIAYTAGKMRRYRIRSIVGDRVHVEMTPYDLSKGRIVYREKIGGPSSGPRRRGFRRGRRGPTQGRALRRNPRSGAKPGPAATHHLAPT